MLATLPATTPLSRWTSGAKDKAPGDTLCLDRKSRERKLIGKRHITDSIDVERASGYLGRT